jgi:hypothetical protein
VLWILELFTATTGKKEIVEPVPVPLSVPPPEKPPEPNLHLSLRDLLTTESVLRVMKEKGYRHRDGSTSTYVNIVGVRSDNNKSDKFDDYILALYRSEEDLGWVCKVWSATTDPGKHWLESPMNPAGTAILVPGQYLDAYFIRKHQGKYEAVCQKSPVLVWRDNNKDDVLDHMASEDGISGVYGINIHRSNPYSESYLVGKWSAGCQVFKKVADFNEFMELCRLSANKMGNSFTYTLLEESDFRN